MRHSKTAAIVVAFFAAALVLSLGGCAVNGEVKAYRDPSVPIVVEKGQEFSIVLESNPSTGYRWQLNKALDEKIVILEKVEFEEPQSDRLGQPGEEKWTFKAQGLGRTTIELKYVRPWEDATSSAEEMSGEMSAGTEGEEKKTEVSAAESSEETKEKTVEAGETEVEGAASAAGVSEGSEEEAVAEEAETLVFSVWVKKKGATDAEPKKYDNPDEPIEVEEGLRFSIVLESNPSTGYQWQLAEPLDETIMTLVSSQFEGKGVSQKEGEGIVGAPGKETWTFEALSEGEAEIVLAYVRPWERGAAPEETKTFKVVVKGVEEKAASEH